MNATPPSDKVRERLRELVERSGRSKREISLSAGLGASFVHELLTTNKVPNVDNLGAVAAQLGTNLPELLA